MKTNILNYSVIIQPDTRTGSKDPAYTAYCPALGIADDGDTVEEALVNLKKTISFHLECLAAEGEEIPSPDSASGLLTNIQVEVPSRCLPA